MIFKLIKATTAPGCKESFIAQQRLWNDAMARQPGFLGVQVATDPKEPDAVWIQIAMESREDLDRFMAGDHDTVQDQTAMQGLYERLDIHVLDVIEPGPPAVRLEVAPSRTATGYQVAMLSELYRASALLRVAVQSGVFDHIGQQGTSLDELATATGTSAELVGRLVEGLGTLNLVRLEKEGIFLAELSNRHLRTAASEYMGDLVLHNTRPALWRRWGSLDESLGLGPDEEVDEHQLFLDAMTGIAHGGQVEALLGAVDLTGRSRLLDIGGGHGDYAVALCRATAGLHAVVLDQAASVAATTGFIGQAGLWDRIAVRAGDYRVDLGPGGFDVVLLSNVLRGETRAQAGALLDRIREAMTPGGLLVLQDLFIDEPRGQGPLLAAFFGLHMPQASNSSLGEARELLEAAGFADVSVTALNGQVASNYLVTARS
jgi:hypothetical protein